MNKTTTNSRRIDREPTTSSRREGRRATRATRRVLLVLAGATLSCLMGAGVASASAEQPKWRLHNVDADACWDYATMDRDRNGYSEDQWLDTDHDCRWDTRVYNVRGHDSILEAMSIDLNENGRPEYLLQNTDQRVGSDHTWYDLNQDGVYERVAKISDPQAEAAEYMRLKKKNTEAQTQALINSMPGVVGNLTELPSFLLGIVR